MIEALLADVTIPHGGLGTLTVKMIEALLADVTIPHGGLGTQTGESLSVR